MFYTFAAAENNGNGLKDCGTAGGSHFFRAEALSADISFRFPDTRMTFESLISEEVRYD